MNDTVISVSDLVSLVNQTLDYAYPVVVVEGEVANFRISKNKWVYFDLKDDNSNVRFFGSVYNIKAPIEDGMMLKVTGNPRLHNLYGFSVTVQNIEHAGEGSIKRAQELLKKNLEKEGLFAEDRKRELPEYPNRIGLITSSQAAAYGDFLKILNQRWGGLEIEHIDVQVQGESAVGQIVAAVNRFSESAEQVDVVVVIRGGGSPEDLAAFSSEPVVRAVAGSRIPTIVGIGHEDDVSLAELAADKRASTPTNAAQIVVPNRDEISSRIEHLISSMQSSLQHRISNSNFVIDSHLHQIEAGLLAPNKKVDDLSLRLNSGIKNKLDTARMKQESLVKSLAVLDPKAVLRRGYSMVKLDGGKVVKSSTHLRIGQVLMLEFEKGNAKAEVTKCPVNHLKTK